MDLYVGVGTIDEGDYFTGLEVPFEVIVKVMGNGWDKGRVVVEDNVADLEAYWLFHGTPKKGKAYRRPILASTGRLPSADCDLLRGEDVVPIPQIDALLLRDPVVAELDHPPMFLFPDLSAVVSRPVLLLLHPCQIQL